MPRDIFDQQPCSSAQCDAISLPLTEPPLCHIHVPDLDAWYETALANRCAVNGARTSYFRGEDFLHEMYRYALASQGLRRTLYEEFEKRKRVGAAVAFSFQDVVFFIVAAAAAGIIGNLSYDALKKLIRRVIASQKTRDETIKILPEVISEQRYRELAESSQNEVIIETEEEIELKLRRTYRLVMRIHTSENNIDT